jgi:hypothetical protein
MKRSYGFQVIEVRLDVFEFKFQCIIGPRENIEKYLTRRWPDIPINPISQTARALTFFRARADPIIWLPRRPRTPKDIGTLAHEVLHVLTAFLVESVGLQLNYETDEAFCYPLGYAIETILERAK